MAKARRWAPAAAGVAIVAVVVVAGVLALSNSRKPRAADPTTKVSVVEQARQVAEALNLLANDPQSLVASDAAGQVKGRARQAVPAGAEVEVDEQSWAPDGLGGGTITVTITAPGKPPAIFSTVMVSEGGRWKVLATLPLTGTAPTTPAASSP